jgi:hypothetical protein
MLSVKGKSFILNVNVLNVIMLSVVMLCVVAPCKYYNNFEVSDSEKTLASTAINRFVVQACAIKPFTVVFLPYRYKLERLPLAVFSTIA